MLHSSGIGTYLQNLIPRVIQALPEVHFTFLGTIAEMQKYPWLHVGNVALVECRAPVYSIREQVVLYQKTPSSTTLFWAPHYNMPLLYRGRLLVTVYDLCHLAVPEALTGIHKRAYARLMYRAVARRAGRIICISRFTKGELLRLVRVSDEKVHTIYPGVDPTWFDVRRCERPHQSPFLLYVGNVKPHKNLHSLLEAFRLLMDSIPHDLVIIGKREGFITGDKAVAAKAAILGDRVIFTGELTNTAVFRQYFVYADVLILPSLYEGFGLPPLEAMACGCPVVVSKVASLPEVCGDAALYCNPRSPEDLADKIALVLNDSTLRSELQTRGLRQARRFTWDVCANETVSVIRTML